MLVQTPTAAELAAQLSSMALQQPAITLPPAGCLLAPSTTLLNASPRSSCLPLMSR